MLIVAFWLGKLGSNSLSPQRLRPPLIFAALAARLTSGGDGASPVSTAGNYSGVPPPEFAEAAAALASGFLRALLWSASSTAARRSTSMRSGWPEEYSAWNITFQDWQIMRRRTTGSSAEN